MVRTEHETLYQRTELFEMFEAPLVLQTNLETGIELSTNSRGVTAGSFSNCNTRFVYTCSHPPNQKFRNMRLPWQKFRNSRDLQTLLKNKTRYWIDFSRRSQIKFRNFNNVFFYRKTRFLVGKNVDRKKVFIKISRGEENLYHLKSAIKFDPKILVSYFEYAVKSV